MPQGVRDALLDAAYRHAVAGDWSLTRMADVAASASVSRQTLYNEFGSKDGLARELVLRHTERFLDEVIALLTAHSRRGIGPAVRAATLFTLERAADDPLLKAVLTSAGGDGLLPLLTTRSEPVLSASRRAVAQACLHARPDLDPAAVAKAADVAVRLTVSHLVLPLEPADVVAGELGDLVERYLGTAAERPAVPDPPPGGTA